ncbi:hypothetical protein LguiA_021464 [Lonicera macranthoides]
MTSIRDAAKRAERIKANGTKTFTTIPLPKSTTPKNPNFRSPISSIMATTSFQKGNTRLPLEVKKVICVRNLPFNITSEKMHDIFGKYIAIR